MKLTSKLSICHWTQQAEGGEHLVRADWSRESGRPMTRRRASTPWSMHEMSWWTLTPRTIVCRSRCSKRGHLHRLMRSNHSRWIQEILEVRLHPMAWRLQVCSTSETNRILWVLNRASNLQAPWAYTRSTMAAPFSRYTALKTSRWVWEMQHYLVETWTRPPNHRKWMARRSIKLFHRHMAH